MLVPAEWKSPQVQLAQAEQQVPLAGVLRAGEPPLERGSQAHRAQGQRESLEQSEPAGELEQQEPRPQVPTELPWRAAQQEPQQPQP